VRPDLQKAGPGRNQQFGKRFDDGIYGDSTRESWGCSKKTCARRSGRDHTEGSEHRRDRGPETKLKRLNFIGT
jgi:hypothetical protein